MSDTPAPGVRRRGPSWWRSGATAVSHSKDLELARSVLAGHREALDRLYRQHHAGLTRHLRAYLGPASAAVEDLTHETFLRAFEHLYRYQGRSSLGTWIHGIALNLARTHRAKESRRDRIGRRLAANPADAPQPSLDESLDRHRAMEAVYSALETLGEEERDAFVLRTLEQLPLKEAAAILGAGVSTVSERNRRAEDKIRAYIETGGSR